MSNYPESKIVVSSRERFWVGLLALLGLGAGHFYLGRFKRAFIVLGVGIFFFGLGVVLVTSPLGMAWPLYLGLAVMVFVPFGALIDTLRLSSSDKSIKRIRGTRWIILSLGFVLCVSSLFSWGASTIKQYHAQSFRVPSAGMEPSLLIGDFFYVDKAAYKSRAPQRGEIAAFHYPKDPRVDYVKRIVGLPGDMIEFQGEILYVNRERITSEYLPGIEQGEANRKSNLRQEEFSDHKYVVKYGLSRARQQERAPFRVPENNYYCLGDNRNNSADSRYWGTIPHEYLIGPVTHIYYSWDKAKSSVRWMRIGKRID